MKAPVRGQGGQLIVEAVLIIVVMMAVTFAVGNYFKSQEVFKSLITKPWQSLAGLLQNGVWGAPAVTNVSHPNGHGRHIVITGEPAQ
jgi:hypothetical protein